MIYDSLSRFFFWLVVTKRSMKDLSSRIIQLQTHPKQSCVFPCVYGVGIGIPLHATLRYSSFLYRPTGRKKSSLNIWSLCWHTQGIFRM